MSYAPANPFSNMFSGGNRSYNSMDTKSVSFGQVFNPHYVNGTISGQWTPITTNDQGAIRVDIGTGINISATVTGVTVNIPPSTAVTGFVNVTGQVAITNPIVPVSGVVQANITNAVVAVSGAVQATVVGTVTAATWGKVKSAGYVATFSASAVPVIVNKVQGFTKTNTQPSFIQLFDAAATPSAGANPDFVVAVQTNNNFFVDLAEAGVVFTNGLQIVSSSTADVYTAIGASDFIVSAIIK